MLDTLEVGVKGGKWYSLMDKVYSEGNLMAAYLQVVRNKGASGVDHVSVQQFGRKAGQELAKLREELRAGSYRPQAIRRVLSGHYAIETWLEIYAAHGRDHANQILQVLGRR